VDVQGKVVSKYFEDDYKDRVSTADILARQFGAPVDAASGGSETKGSVANANFPSTFQLRLSRKYAYQVLLSEELSRCGVELIFLKAPAGTTPEDQLLVQFQGMIAEYERAQIAERCRRGKKAHCATRRSECAFRGRPTATGM